MVDYVSITEVPGLQGTREQLSRLYHRYRFASASISADKANINYKIFYADAVKA